MFYKFGLEFFNGSITTLATDRFNSVNTFTKRMSFFLVWPSCFNESICCVVGAAQGINQAAQCVGAILIAPLIKRWPTRTVLTAAILLFGLMTTILLIVDAATRKPIFTLYNSLVSMSDQTARSNHHLQANPYTGVGTLMR